MYEREFSVPTRQDLQLFPEDRRPPRRRMRRQSRLPLAMLLLSLASFAGEGTSFAGTAFLKSYVGVCLEGAIIVLACLIFSAFMSSGTPVVDTSLSAVTMSWQYIGETIFNMMVLVGLVKGAERIVKEMFGL